MSEKTLRAYACHANYNQPDGDEIRITVRARRRAPKGSKTEYGNHFINLELSVPPYIARDLVKALQSGMSIIKSNKAQDLRTAESWMEDIRKAATP